MHRSKYFSETIPAPLPNMEPDKPIRNIKIFEKDEDMSQISDLPNGTIVITTPGLDKLVELIDTVQQRN